MPRLAALGVTPQTCAALGPDVETAEELFMKAPVGCGSGKVGELDKQVPRGGRKRKWEIEKGTYWGTSSFLGENDEGDSRKRKSLDATTGVRVIRRDAHSIVQEYSFHYSVHKSLSLPNFRQALQYLQVAVAQKTCPEPYLHSSVYPFPDGEGGESEQGRGAGDSGPEGGKRKRRRLVLPGVESAWSHLEHESMGLGERVALGTAVKG